MKQYRYIIAGIVALSVLVLLRSYGTGRFRYDADGQAGPSYTSSNIIRTDKVSSIEGNKLIIILDPDKDNDVTIEGREINIPAPTILTREARKTIRAHDGPVLLWSGSESTSARVWMLLSQSGFKNIYIVVNEPETEKLNEKIRSDNTTTPDL